MITAHPLFKRITQFIHAENLFSGIEHVDVAVSGGADSICLLAILSTLPKTFSLRVHHIRHGLRPDDQNDTIIAQNAAKAFGIEWIQTNLTWPQGIPKANIEDEARKARYEALLGALANISHSAIALAHHGDENLETALWRLGRGCGTDGLSLSPRRVIQGIDLIRPLLMVSKDEIYAFLKDNHLEWAEDPSNQSDAYRRNRIRHIILPNLKDETPSQECLYRSLITIRHDAEALSDFAQNFVAQHPLHAGCWFCPWNDWNPLNRGTQAQILRHAARSVLAGHCPTLNFIQKALEILHIQSQTCRQIENGQIHIGWFRGGVMIWNDLSEISFPKIDLELPCQQQKIWNICELSAWFSVPESSLTNTTSMIHIDAECLDGSISVQPASDFREMKTSTGNLCKVKDALKSQGIPEKWRPEWPVLCVLGRPLWIFGGMRTLDAHPAIPGKKAATFIVSWR